MKILSVIYKNLDGTTKVQYRRSFPSKEATKMIQYIMNLRHKAMLNGYESPYSIMIEENELRVTENVKLPTGPIVLKIIKQRSDQLS